MPKNTNIKDGGDDLTAESDARRKYNKILIKTGFVFLLLVAVIVGRLAFLVLARGDEYVAMAQSSRLKTVTVREYERGDIIDCNGVSFTNNEESCLVAFPQLVSDSAWLIRCFSEQLDESSEAVTDGWRSKLAENEPFIICRNLEEWQAEKYNDIIEENDLTGIFVLNMRPRYLLSDIACHVLGFVGEPDEQDVQELAAAGLPENTMIGKSGIEYQYNEWLMGRGSEKIGVIADEKARQISDNLRLVEGEKTSGMGYDVQLTLNRDYQRFLDEAMAGKSGGAVLMNVENGDILAASSAPGYDQYEGQGSAEGSDYINKAFAYYPPASVFKTVLVLAALEEGVQCSNDFYCNGAITLSGGHRVKCWRETGHGQEDLEAALGNSCNPYFVNLGQQLGGSLIKDYAYNLGLGEQKIIGYNVASMEDNIDFNVGSQADVANVSIGENGVRLSPLLVAQLMSAVANGGKVVTPRLVKGVLADDGSYLKEFAAAEPRQVASAESCEILQRLLTSAVTTGTGSPVNSGVVQIAGKTGTSQDAGVWFAGFAPADNPRYAIAVYDEDGESGGSDAGVVAKEVFEQIAVLEGFR